jgi:hypothetical protein
VQAAVPTVIIVLIGVLVPLIHTLFLTIEEIVRWQNAALFPRRLAGLIES